jgi:hypothetical protein
MARKREIPKVVEAEKFVLCDSKGRGRALLYLRDGEPAFQLLDSKGIPRVTIEMNADGHHLIRVETSDGQGIGMGVTKDGGVGAGFTRPGGLPAFEIGSHAGEEVRIVVYDKEGRPVWQSLGPVERST